MAAVFPLDTSQPWTNNGVTYEYDASEDRWYVVSTNATDKVANDIADLNDEIDALELTVATDRTVIISTRPPADPDDGDLWFDCSEDSLTLFVYYELSLSWVPAAPPSTLEGRIAEGEQIQQEILTRLGLNETLTDGHVDKIADLENKVEALEGNTLSGQWALALTGSPRPGKVLLYKDGFAGGVTSWSDVKYLGFYPEDIGGVTHDFSDIIVDEYIRFTTSVGEANAVTFKVTDNSSGGGVFGVVISVEKGVPVDEEVYGVEFLPPFDPSQYATVDYVDDQDYLKLDKTGGTLTGTLRSKVGTKTTVAFNIKNSTDDKTCINIWAPGGAGSQIKYVGRNDTDHWFQVYDDTDANPKTTAKFAYEQYEFAAKPNITYSATDAHYFQGRTIFNKSGGDPKVDIAQSNTDFYTKARFKEGLVVKGTGQSIDGDNVLFANSDYAAYNGRIQNNDDIVNKEYVDSQAGVPVGTVVMWFGTTEPIGWLKCDGSSFSTTTYAALHTHLQTVPGYSTGKTPDFRGLYPGGAGSAHNNQLTSGGESKTNIYHSQRTAKPNGGAPKSTTSIPDGSIRTFNAAGNTNAYSNGVARVNITEGWDLVTRPPTLSVHFIIKH